MDHASALESLRQRLRGVDRLLLLSDLSALQLLPQNAGRLAVIESASEFVASLEPDDARRPPSHADLRLLLRTFDMTTDPFEGLFTESLVVPGHGPAVVTPGRDPAAGWVLQAVVAAFTGGPPFPDPDLQGAAVGMIRSALILADAASRRAGLTRGLSDVGRPSASVTIPPAAELASRRSAVRFSTNEITELLGSQGLDLLSPLADGLGRKVDFADAQLVVDEMVRRARMVESMFAGEADDPPKSFFHLFVLQGVGRMYHVGLEGPEDPTRSEHLLISAAELDVVAAVEDRDPLALLKFARAAGRFQREVRVLHFGTLDLYALYHRLDRTFYLDDGRPTFVTIDPGSGQELRARVQQERDIHAAPLPGRRSFTEVRLLEEDVRIPLYAQARPADGSIRLLCELDVDVWIVTRPPQHPRGIAIALNLSHTVAYWCWQFWPSIGEMISPLVRLGQLVLTLDLRPGPEYDNATEAPLEPVTCAEQPGGLQITVPSTLLNLLGSSDNTGERELMRAVLRGLREAAARQGGTTPSDDVLGGWIEQHAPLGRKKKSLLLSPGYNPDFLDQGLPRLRRVQEPDLAEVLDDMGEALQASGLAVGRIPDDRRLEVMRDAVMWCFDQLTTTVATLNPEGLLEWLISRHEAILNRQALEGVTIPTRLACYPELSELPGKMEEQRVELISSAIATRIVIEAVAASPPNGERPISLVVHDRLLALAHQGVNLAFDRDALQNGLHDDAVSILASGRLGVRRQGRYHTGRAAYLEANARLEIERASEFFSRHWHAVRPRRTLEGSAIDVAAVDEFGASLMDLTRFLAEVVGIGVDDLRGEAKVMSRAVLAERLAAALGVSGDQVERLLELFTLGARPSLMEAPAGFEPADAYPWRFNRALSYMRRPLVERAGPNGTELVWGTRHIMDANENLIALCHEGRLRAKTPAMRLAMTNLRQEETKAFNRAVADKYRNRPELIVRENVEKIGKVRIARPSGEKLGDIDVLVVDPVRRLLRPVETKDLGIARTPLEMGQQLRKTFGGNSHDASDVDRHLERTQWIREHLREVLDWLGIRSEDARRWKVKPILVIDEPLMTPYVTKPRIPVVAFRDLDP